MPHFYDHSVDRFADRYFSRLLDSPEERAARGRPTPPASTRDECDSQRDWNTDHFSNHKGQTEREVRG